MVKKVGATAPSEMSPDEHLQDVQRRLKEMGVTSVSLSFAPGVKGQPASEVKKNVANFFEAYLAGKTKPMMLLDVEGAEVLAARDGITVAQAKKKYKNVPLTGSPEPEAVEVKTKRKYVRKEKPVVAKNAWPFANPKPVGLPDGKPAMVDDDRLSVQVLSGVGAEPYKPKKTTVKRVAKKALAEAEPTGTEALLKPDNGWPFPNAKREEALL